MTGDLPEARVVTYAEVDRSAGDRALSAYAGL